MMEHFAIDVLNEYRTTERFLGPHLPVVTLGNAKLGRKKRSVSPS